jgi:hypothetical protein
MKNPKIIVWLDVDDVLLDFKHMYNRHLKENYGIKIPENYQPLTWDYTEVLPKKIKFPETMKTLGKFWTSNQTALPGAAQFTKTLEKLGVHIILITHIEGEQAPDRLAVLTDQKICFHEAYFTMGRTKGDFAKQVVRRYPKAINLFMDDKAANVVEFLNEVPRVHTGITLTVPYNDGERSVILENDFGKILWVKDPEQMYQTMIKVVRQLLKEKKV